jgi:hypothetical protein
MKRCGFSIRTLRTGLLAAFILHSSLLHAFDSILIKPQVKDTTKQVISPNNSFVKNATDGLTGIPKNLLLDDAIFTEMTDIQLTGVSESSSAWGDYNNDGFLDILITGVYNYGSPPVAILYRNNGNSTFTEQTSISLTGVGNSSVTWGDYDNDGDLDILISGLDKSGPVCKIFRNDGSNIFTEMSSISFTGVGSGSVQWGDYDNDGDLDILLTGNTNTGWVSKIYRNDRNNIFTEQTSITLTVVSYSSVQWGDYDNDGDLDILLTGNSNSGYISKIYRNDGNNVFSEQSSIALTGVYNGSVAWGDYDNDGDLDILLSGGSNSGYISKIYRNDGNNTFAEQNSILLTGVTNSAVQWGDYDNDGDLDILLSGATGGIPYAVTKIYRNDGSNIFTEQTSVSLSGITYGSAQWGDYDNDGDLDILLTGWGISKIYRNDCAKTNTSPKVPSGLTVIPNGKNVTLSWTSQGDIETPSSSLTYNIRVGTTPGGSEIVSPHSMSNGKLKVPAMGNAQLGTTFYLKNLSMNKYYWSVQAVDNGYKGSAFASETSFTLINADPTVTVIAAKDITLTGAVLSGTVNPNNAITSITFEYGTTAGVYGNWKSVAATPNSLTGTNITSVETRLTGLNSGTIYYYRVKAMNSLGTSYSQDMSFTTPPMFTEMTGIQLTGIYEGSSAWGDYNNDGFLDILITGITNNGNAPISKIYKNNGNNTFTEQTSISLTGIGNSSVTWGDYDNDGDLDILISGLDELGPVCKIYRNDRNNIFTQMSSISLTSVSSGSVKWGDYDNDGDLDILLTGNSTTGRVSKIYRNDRNNIFTEQTSISLAGVNDGCAQWADYDNDGDLDVFLTGYSNSGYVTKIYRNDGTNFFPEQTNILLPAVSNGTLQLGDYDNDGDLDILLSGGSNSGYISKIYRNDGNNTFTEQNSILLTGVSGSSVNWGDYDNDGDLDILLAGSTGGIPYSVSKIYRNDGNNKFTEQSNILLDPVSNGSVQWGDYDNDGDLDILLTGGWISKIYRNNSTIVNSAPNTPTGLTDTKTGKNVTLSWTQPGDVETPGPALSYNVRVGITPGGSEILSPHALGNGKLTVPGMGNAQLGTTFILKSLPFNTYYWSVQAIDNGYMGSTFSKEESFKIGPDVITGQVEISSAGSATLIGSINPRGFSLNASFIYGLSETTMINRVNITQTLSSTGGVQDVSALISGLSAVTYYYKLEASDGSSIESGAIKTFNNNAPWIVSYNANNITINSASLVAIVNPKCNSSVVVFEYGTTTALGQVASALPNTISGSADQEITATINSLNKNTTYYYRVKATNSSGTNYSSIKQFLTLCDDNILSTIPTGVTSICQGTLQSTYTTSSSNATSYIWELTPATAGTIAGAGSTCNVFWNPAFNGNAQIRVRGENGTCQSIWTSQLDVNLIKLPVSARINGLQNVCKGEDYIKYSVIPENGMIYSWDVFGGNILDGAETPEISVQWSSGADTGNVILTRKLLSTGCAFTDIQKITLKNYLLPAKPVIKKKGGINLLICLTPDMHGYQWYLNNEPISGANGQYYEARKTIGAYRVVISDILGCFSRSEEMNVGTATGMVIYPNPTRGEINVELSCEQVGEVLIKVIDAYGVIKYIGRSEKTGEKLAKPVILNNFVKGLYLIDIEIAGEKIGNEKILIY